MVGLLELMDELKHFLWVSLDFIAGGMLVEEVEELTLATFFALVDIVSSVLIDNAVLRRCQGSH